MDNFLREMTTGLLNETELEAVAVLHSDTAAQSIRVNLERIENLLNHVGQLVIAQTYLAECEDLSGVLMDYSILWKKIAEVGKITREIQHVSASLRMVSLQETFQKLQRFVHETSKAWGREITFIAKGDDVEVDNTVLDRIYRLLVCLLRNAVDHELESSEERRAAGKALNGTVQLLAYRRGGSVVIEVRDDGSGIEAIEPVASDDAGARLATEADMDIIHSTVRELQGTIQVQSAAGQGSCYRVILPLTRPIVPGMIVRLGSERYVVPLSNISESVRPKREDVSGQSGVPHSFETLRLRGESVPVFRLADLLGRPNTHPNAWDGVALVVRDVKAKPFSLLVDEIVGSQQVVIKPLGADLEGLPGIAGGAILGDGQAALILDINQIIEAAA